MNLLAALRTPPDDAERCPEDFAQMKLLCDAQGDEINRLIKDAVKLREA